MSDEERPPTPGPSGASDDAAGGTAPGPGSVPPPQNPYGPTQPYGTPPPPQNPYGAPQNPYAPPPNPYPQPGSFDQYEAPNPYGAQPYGTYPPGYGAGLPDHPSATTALVLGIVGLVGIALCGGITLVLSPFAWVIGGRAVREIDAEPGRYAGRDRANAGRIMGIIGTVLLVLGVVALIGIIALIVAVPSGGTIGPSTPVPSFQNGAFHP